MKLLQISDDRYINPEMITYIYDLNENSCYIGLASYESSFVCDKYNAQQLMSKICEEVYYGDDGICKEDK